MKTRKELTLEDCRAISAAAEAEAAETPPPPSYSEEDLAAARQSAYQEGHAAGLALAPGAPAGIRLLSHG